MIDSDTNGDGADAAGIKFQADNCSSSTGPSALKPEPLNFETLLNALPCPVYYKDTQGVFLSYNKSFSDVILGNRAPCLIGKSVADLKGCIPDDLIATFMAKDAALVEGAETQICEAPVRCGDGKTRYFAFHKSAFQTANGQTGGIVGLLLDITDARETQAELSHYQAQLEEMVARRSAELTTINKRLSNEVDVRRKAEKALLANEELYRKVFDNTGTATILIEPDMTISMVNARAAQLVGMTREQITGRTNTMDFIVPAHRERIKLYHELRMQGETSVPRQFEFQITDAKGRIRDMLANVQWMPETRQTIASMLDITESKQLQLERQRLAAVIDQSAEAVIITDNHGNIEYINQAFENLSGFDRRMCIGQTMEAPFLCDLDRQIFKQMTFMVSGDDFWTGRVENQRRDGQTYIADTRIFPVSNEKGKVVNLVCVKTDVTHEVHLEKELQQAQKMEAIGTLAGGIAHDFNNILGGILGYTEISLLRVGENQQLKRNLGRILDGCHRAKELVQNILTFSRKNEEETKPLEIQIIIKEALKLLRASIPSTIEFRQDIGTQPSIVCATPTQIHQVIMNLCTNAAHAMQQNGGLLEVKLENVDLAPEQCEGKADMLPGPYSCLTVQDTGEGIDPANLERIFEPYFTTKEQTGGTGLGLSMVHGIIKSFGGTLSVESRVGEGTTFTIYLPRVEDTAKAEEPVSEDLPKGREHILVADDEHFILEIIADMLRCLGYEIETAGGGTEAWERFSKNPDRYDAVIADLTMPKITGKQLAEKIRHSGRNLPIILTTGMAIDAAARDVLFNEFAAVLSKPILYNDLANTLRRVLDERQDK
jgi:PAS domain S-box-containing protein